VAVLFSETANEVVIDADYVISILPNGAIVESVFIGDSTTKMSTGISIISKTPSIFSRFKSLFNSSYFPKINKNVCSIGKLTPSQHVNDFLIDNTILLSWLVFQEYSLLLSL